MSDGCRAPAFGAVLASLSLGILIGPAIGGMLDPLTASLTASVIGALCMLYVVFFLAESLSPHAAAAVILMHITEPFDGITLTVVQLCHLFAVFLSTTNVYHQVFSG